MKKSTAPLFDYYELPKAKAKARGKTTSAKTTTTKTSKKTSSTKSKYGRTIHGGADTKGSRKEYRPLSEKKWIHLTLKSAKAKGPWSFLTPKNQAIINKILKEKSKKWGIKIAEVANVGNHLHIKLKFKYREGFQNFLRSVTSLIARKITNARRGHKIEGETLLSKTKTSKYKGTNSSKSRNTPDSSGNSRNLNSAEGKAIESKSEKFWQGLAFTRVVKTSFEELQLKGYFEANRREAAKGEKARAGFLDQFNEWIQSLRKQSTA